MHRLSGRWTSRVFNHSSGQIPILRDDGRFELEIDDAGTVLGSSRHHRPNGTVNVVTGRAETTGLILTEVVDIAGTTMIFSGLVIIDGIISRLLVGDAVRVPVGDAMKARRPRDENDLVGQEEGTWVITQP